MRVYKPQRFNTRLFNLRSAKHLSQEKFADLLGVNRNLIGSIETGETYGKINFWIEVQKKFHIPNEEMWNLIVGDENGQTV